LKLKIFWYKNSIVFIIKWSIHDEGVNPHMVAQEFGGLKQT